MYAASLLTMAQTPAAPQSGSGVNFFFLAMMGAMVVFMLLSSRSRRKREQREKDEMYASMAKNHRVQTVGGIIGTVYAVKDDEVILKVDESTNTKMTFLKTAVQKILSDEPSGSGN